MPARLRGCFAQVHASLNGRDFVKIADVTWPTHEYLHTWVKPGWLYYYRVKIFDENESMIAESPIVMGAAGPNLVDLESFESRPTGTVAREISYAPSSLQISPLGAFSIIQGARTYGAGRRLLAFDPARADVGQVAALGNLIPIAPGKRFLQGGWVRAPGNVWYGRYFYDHDADFAPDEETLHIQSAVGFGYAAMAIQNTPQWTFLVQLLEVDADGSSFPREGKTGHERNTVARKGWTFPRDAGYMRLFITAFGAGELDDPWIVEVRHAPARAKIVPQ
jgi:hypothetical protein